MYSETLESVEMKLKYPALVSSPVYVTILYGAQLNHNRHLIHCGFLSSKSPLLNLFILTAFEGNM